MTWTSPHQNLQNFHKDSYEHFPVVKQLDIDMLGFVELDKQVHVSLNNELHVAKKVDI